MCLCARAHTCRYATCTLRRLFPQLPSGAERHRSPAGPAHSIFSPSESILGEKSRLSEGHVLKAGLPHFLVQPPEARTLSGTFSLGSAVRSGPGWWRCPWVRAGRGPRLSTPVQSACSPCLLAGAKRSRERRVHRSILVVFRKQPRGWRPESRQRTTPCVFKFAESRRPAGATQRETSER